MILKSYSELIEIPNYTDRFKYLKLNGCVGSETFGFDRYLNQALYWSQEWRSFRNLVIIRDQGFDMGVEGYNIVGRIIIHHINPITPEQIEDRDPLIFSMDNVICVSHKTHEAIHYGDQSILPSDPIIRKPFDTCPWKEESCINIQTT